MQKMLERQRLSLFTTPKPGRRTTYYTLSYNGFRYDYDDGGDVGLDSHNCCYFHQKRAAGFFPPKL